MRICRCTHLTREIGSQCRLSGRVESLTLLGGATATLYPLFRALFVISHVVFAHSAQVIHVSGELSPVGNVCSVAHSACGSGDGAVGVDSRAIDGEHSRGICDWSHSVRTR